MKKSKKEIDFKGNKVLNIFLRENIFIKDDLINAEKLIYHVIKRFQILFLNQALTVSHI